jgi:hypothetical protein
MALLTPPCFEIIKDFDKKNKNQKIKTFYTSFLNISIHG